MERQAQLSIDPSTQGLISTHLVPCRAGQITARLLDSQWPGKSVPMQQDKLGQARWMLHISKTQPETAASLGCPSLPCPTATCSFLLSARIYNVHCPDRTFFAFRKHTKYTDITENTQVVSVPRLTQGGDCHSNVRQAVRKHQECAAAGTPHPAGSGGNLGLFLLQPCLVQQHIPPLKTQLETSLSEQKPRKSKRNTNYYFDLDSYLGLSLLLQK